MIDEVIEVKNYIEGRNIDKKILYRTVYLIAKWYKEQGYTHKEIREAIFDWGKKHGVYIKFNVNTIINKVSEDKTRLKDNITIKINNKDIDTINDRFDANNTKLTALAVLCYAKAFANRDSVFSISSVVLSSWTGIADSHLRGRYLKELIDFEYISKLYSPVQRYSWDNGKDVCSYKINADIHNSGKYILKANDIRDLFYEVFC